MSFRRQRVLVVDDEPHILRTLTFVLKREGYEVASAVDGEQAVERIRTFKPALVFVDAMMPKRDGYGVCREVRGDESVVPQPYIIMLTAGGQEADRERADRAGADEFMTKPFSPSKLVARVREVLAPSP